jgi:hypothetical protein
LALNEEMGVHTTIYSFDTFATGFVDLIDDLFLFDLLDYVSTPDISILYDIPDFFFGDLTKGFWEIDVVDDDNDEGDEN